MTEILYSLDVSVFIFINGTLANPLFDATMAWITNWNQSPVGIALLVGGLAFLITRGGKKGRLVFLQMILLISLTDPLSSRLLKSLVERPRPCHEVGGVRLVQNIHMLVDCGSGYSFPSSHAVNNFALAALLSFYYRRYTLYFFLYAGLMGLSRIVVGVHFPSDVIGGGIIGMLVASGLIWAWNQMGKKFPALAVAPEPPETTPDI